MTTLITGAGGFLGQALVLRLLARGATDLRAFVRPGPKGAALSRLGVDVVVGTLTSPADCARAVAGDVDLVYHLAAGMGGAAAELFLHGAVATQHLAEALHAAGRKARVVHVSSFSVYGTAPLGRGALVDETTPTETQPARRDLYAQAKLRQEQVLWEAHERHGLPLVVVRPGVIYGPGGGGISGRVGLALPGLFLSLGGKNRLPLTYVDNCAEALAVAAQHGTDGQVYNAVDDDLPTCDEYLAAYQRSLGRKRVLRLPYPALMALSHAVLKYHDWSKGQMPAIFTPYKTRSMWGGNRFANDRLKSIGWRPIVATDEGMRRTFAALVAAGGMGA